ncbi:MAG: hypothetical protein ACI9CF_000099 [Candidatus Omnitrophota bacterium]|jgi:uncharacterized protein YyaL (SSP411 family)
MTNAQAEQKPMHTNELVHEKSPYLLQHAHNPVNWYPWGAKAFEKAKTENKPIFLSIGYSTCHWCHVMEEESFENEAVAALLNQNFISIKVDREERPDIDQIYMSFVIATTGSGGWPMSVFLTPDRNPFYGGTYFPPDDRYGRPGFKSVLTKLSESWKEKREEIEKSGTSFVDYFNQHNASTDEELPDASFLTNAYRLMSENHDKADGGFGSAPKFPSPHSLMFLMRYFQSTGEQQALAMSTLTLDKMADGGIYDRLAGGFHRYSVDKEWFVPHFEKMLYDQAMLLKAYSEAYNITQKPLYASVIRETVDYLLRDLLAPEGAFYSAEDADSFDPIDPNIKREGAFYVWSWTDLTQVLSDEELNLAAYIWGLDPGGNVQEDPHHEFTNQNILHQVKTELEATSKFNKTLEEINTSTKQIQKKLFALQQSRPRPHLDDKILTDWNGLLISALAKSAKALDEPKFTQAAEGAAEFLLNTMKQPDGTLYHRFRKGEAGIAGQLDDYVFLAEGLMDLYSVTAKVSYLIEAQDLMDIAIRDFWDEETESFFMTGKDQIGYLIVRPKNFHDGATPSGNSSAITVLLKLSKMTQNKLYAEIASKLLSTFKPQLSSGPLSHSQALNGLNFWVGPTSEVVIKGDPQSNETQALVEIVQSTYLPNSIVLFNYPEQSLETFAPWTQKQTLIDSKPTAYVCKDYVCGLPTNEINKLKELLATL